MKNLRFRVFTPWGNQGQILRKFVTFSCSQKLNDHSVLTLQVPSGSEAEQQLEGEKEVALEVQFGDSWVEPPGCRFKTVSSDVDLVKPAATRDFSFKGLSDLLNDALIWDATPGNEEGKRVFLAQTPGKMLGSVLKAAKQRGGADGWAPGLAWLFTDSHDSAGQPWGKNASNDFVPTAPVFKVVKWLASKGAVDWRMQGRELQVFRSGGTMARELPGIVLRKEQSSAFSIGTTVENLVTTALMRGKDGKQWTRTSSESESAFGRIEVGIDQGQVTRDDTANLHMESKLKAGEVPSKQYRREWTYDSEDMPLLWRDYQIGDWVSVNGEKMRITEAGVECDENGVVTGWETLGTRRDSLLERLARRTTDLSDGMVGGENSPVAGAIGPENETGQPAAPAGLLVSSDPLALADGAHRSVVGMSWQPVTSTVDSKPVSIQAYQVRIVENGASSFFVTATDTDLNRTGYPGDRWRIQVRALSRQNVWSPWSELVDHVLAEDEEAPPKPESPVLDNELGILRISTSGVTDDGGGMPADVAMWEVAVSTSDTENPTADSTVADAGGLVWYKAGLTPGVTYYVRIRAVDRSGNKSPWSESTRGTVGKVFDDASLRAEIRNGTIIGPGAIKTPHLAALSVGADQLAANAVEASKMKVGALDGFVLTGATVQTDRQASRGVKLNSQGLFAYDSNGRQTVRITGNGGAIEGYAIRGGVLESESRGSRVRISNGELVISKNGQDQLWLDDDGLHIKEGSRTIGSISSIHKFGEPEVRGLSTSLNHSGDYISWSYQEAPNSNTYTTMLTLDPHGKMYPNEPGIHAGEPLWIRQINLGDWALVGSGSNLYLSNRKTHELLSLIDLLRKAERL